MFPKTQPFQRVLAEVSRCPERYRMLIVCLLHLLLDRLEAGAALGREAP